MSTSKKSWRGKGNLGIQKYRTWLATLFDFSPRTRFPFFFLDLRLEIAESLQNTWLENRTSTNARAEDGIKATNDKTVISYNKSQAKKSYEVPFLPDGPPFYFIRKLSFPHQICRSDDNLGRARAHTELQKKGSTKKRSFFLVGRSFRLYEPQLQFTGLLYPSIFVDFRKEMIFRGVTSAREK